MQLTSEAFSDGAPIPRQYTCDGEDQSPSLKWTGAPSGTKSFVLLVDDPDAPGGLFHHWACYDIPASEAELGEGAGRAAGGAFRHGVNDFRQAGYRGPCPPHGHGRHRYRFRLLALDCDALPVGGHPSCVEVEEEARKHLVAEARLTGLYPR